MANTRLFTLTANTWVENHHTPWIGIKYTGKLYINGSERYKESGKTMYPRSIKMTYDVQGTKRSETIYSSGNATIRGTLEVYDKLNFGPKTKVYYDYQGTAYKNFYVMSTNDDK